MTKEKIMNKLVTLYTERQAAQHLGCRIEQLQYRRRKKLPPLYHITNGRVYYNLKDLQVPILPLQTRSGITFDNLRDKIRVLSRLEFETFSLS